MNAMAQYTFADFLSDEIKQRSMSASEFARWIDVSPSTVTRAMAPRNATKPGFDFLLKLSKKTGRSLFALIELAYPDEAEASKLSPEAQVIAQQIEDLEERDVELIRRILRGRVK
jgi:transcriptional regulator with XRE-family HTH domain